MVGGHGSKSRSSQRGRFITRADVSRVLHLLLCWNSPLSRIRYAYNASQTVGLFLECEIQALCVVSYAAKPRVAQGPRNLAGSDSQARRGGAVDVSSRRPAKNAGDNRQELIAEDTPRVAAKQRAIDQACGVSSYLSDGAHVPGRELTSSVSQRETTLNQACREKMDGAGFGQRSVCAGD
jgi:hypothetical protein